MFIVNRTAFMKMCFGKHLLHKMLPTKGEGVRSQIHLGYAANSIAIRKFLKDLFMISSHWEMTTRKTKRHHLLTN